jgi:membrane-associated phospholipid phosphatase
MLEQIVKFDFDVAGGLQRIRAIYGAGWHDWLFWFFALSVTVAILAAVYYYWFYKKDRFTVYATVYGSIILFAIIEMVKRLVARARPDGSDYHSFPSRHTALAFYLALVLPVGLPARVLLLGWTFLVGFSRLWLQDHFVSDIVAGAGFGAVGAWLALKYKKEIKQKLKIK